MTVTAPVMDAGSVAPAADGGPALLTVEHLTMRFGGLVAIDDVSFEAADAQITAIIGPNGAGKTTVFNCLTGFYKPTVGQLAFHGDGEELLLEQMEGFRIARAGVARTFQNIRLFGQMSVLENLIVAQHNELMRASGYTVLGVLGVASYRQAEQAAVERARHWLERIGLTERADWNAANLPYGEQRKLEIERNRGRIYCTIRGMCEGACKEENLRRYDRICSEAYYQSVEGEVPVRI